MDEMYGLRWTGHEYEDRALMSPENLMLPAEYYYHQYNCHSTINDNDPAYDFQQRIIPAVFGSEELGFHGGSVVSESASVNVRNQREGDEDEKAKIVSHPCYPKLLDAYIDCQKVGAPPELVSLLDEIRREKDSVFSKQDAATMSAFGVDPELDEFMETYCDILVKYKTDLSKPFDEATSFLNKIEAKLSNLCNDENGGLSSDEEEEEEQEEEEEEEELRNHGEIEIQGQSQDQQLIKEKLLRRYGSQINSLKHEFSKKKKKGKLPKEAKKILLHWWNLHSKWPYPTEPDKIGLAEATGLDQKQINNWFINQRKRHWKSPETTFMSPNAGHNFNFNSQQ